AEVREWLSHHCPESMRGSVTEDQIIGGGKRQTFDNPAAKAWLDAMAEKGWTAPTWPKADGGGGLDKSQHQILQDELQRIQA
ncbi:MAG: acyl-CoA dehydrogenase family protein, partial [Pseudomonadales bacterium]